jgi:CRP-like cAMP-binding protein
MTAQETLKQTALFSQLSDAAIAEVAAALSERRLAPGEVLFHQGQPGDAFYIVESGVVAIFAPQPNDPAAGAAIRIFHPGQALGEMALIDRQPRSMSARAEDESLVLALHADDFRRLLAQNADLAQAVMGGLSERIRYTTSFLDEVRGWVHRMLEDNYTAAAEPRHSYADPTLAALAQDFARMAMVVQEREELLRREVQQLRIEIDQAKRKSDADAIMGSEYYQQLKERARLLREKKA